QVHERGGRVGLGHHLRLLRRGCNGGAMARGRQGQGRVGPSAAQSATTWRHAPPTLLTGLLVVLVLPLVVLVHVATVGDVEADAPRPALRRPCSSGGRSSGRRLEPALLEALAGVLEGVDGREEHGPEELAEAFPAGAAAV